MSYVDLPANSVSIYLIDIQSLRPNAKVARFTWRYMVDSIDEARGVAINDLQLVGWNESVDFHIVSVKKLGGSE